MAIPEAAVVNEAFRSQFGSSTEPAVYRAPGRVNLIGEHTDYNLGYVMPIAMDMACLVAAAPSRDGMFRVYSQNVDQRTEWPAAELASLKPQRHWTDYIVGIVQQIHRLDLAVEGMNLAIYSTVPVGSGLSSSAAIEVSTALAVLGGREVDRTELARLAQRAEREFVGMPCGIMDQYVSVFGERGKAIRIDCRTVTHEAVTLPEEVSLVAVNSLVKHDLGASEYPVRVRECAEAVSFIQQAYPAVNSLRDVSSEILDRVSADMPDVVYRRAHHVVSEDERVIRFTDACAREDCFEMGRLFLASHRSLQHDYEVSCEELDFLVDTASDFSGVYGSRMTGGGFGGCTVNLIAPERVAAFKQHITAAYRRRYDITPAIYDCVPAEGAGRIA
jgi:galactokinase